jgi:uncharacterized protein Veg
MNIEVEEKGAIDAFYPSLFIIRCSIFDIQKSTKSLSWELWHWLTAVLVIVIENT